MQDIEKATRERAYQLWIESGCLDGHADAHWLTAQREILSASLSQFGRVAEASQKKSKVSRKRRRAA